MRLEVCVSVRLRVHGCTLWRALDPDSLIDGRALAADSHHAVIPAIDDVLRLLVAEMETRSTLDSEKCLALLAAPFLLQTRHLLRHRAKIEPPRGGSG